MNPPRIALIGDGRMGQTVAQLAQERGWPITAVISESHNANGTGITRDTLGIPDVAIEFTEPHAARANISACVRARCPVVVGTTGWYDQLPAVEEEVRAAGGSLLYAPNFSVGVNLFVELARSAAEIFGRTPDLAPHLIETHHSAKKDAPSGTALAIKRAMEEKLGRSIPVTSVRTGSVPGTHELTFDGTFEQIRMSHEARDRRVFADGALRAAEWLVGRKGVFTMRDVLGFGETA